MKKLLLLLFVFCLSDAMYAQCTAIVTYSNVSCYGYCDGVAVATGTNGTPPYVFHWSNNAIGVTIPNLCAGTYYVTMIDGAGCIDYDTVTITQPQPLIINQSITNPSCPTCSDGFASLSVTGGSGNYSYVWCTAATTPFTNIGVGCCDFSVTDNLTGCTQIDSACASYTVGVFELNNSSVDFSIFPNPTTKELNIAITPDSNSSFLISIINAVGEIVFQKTLNTNEKKLDISTLPNGLYFLKLDSKENTITKKIIKQ